MKEFPNMFAPLRQQLLDAAARFATDAQPLSDLLTAMVNDIERAIAEPLELFPVCHHSPSSALHIVRRLRERPPKVIYMEGCEDLQAVIEHLQDCKLPVALQAFAGESDAFPPSWTPLSVVLPLTESSAEYQAIAYALQHPDDVQLVFVDYAVDFVFQWTPQEEDALKKATPDEENLPSEEAGMHGTAVGVELGDMTPTFDTFLEFLLRNANTRHFAEWWDQYVEQAVIGSDYQTYRQVMFLVGSLLRRLGRNADDIRKDELREKYMWTRIKTHLRTNKIDPSDAIYICGAAHTASHVEEFGVNSDAFWAIPPRTNTKWLYGLIPSRFAAIEYQFGNPAGTVSLAETSWKKGLKSDNLKSFLLERPDKKGAKKTSKKTQASASPAVTSPVVPGDQPTRLADFLTRPPQLAQEDEGQLLQWCADIVALARKNGYLSSTADSIAIYETSMLLANLRNRPHPSPYDFQDAAVTCLEKDRTPKKRNIAQLCLQLLGGDRVGVVGYASLPPLVQNIYDRLEPLKVNLSASTIQRALMDFKSSPELLACSDVLWRLNYLLSDSIVQPIMGERTLGHVPVQESWDIRIGKYQGAVIQLGYEGVTLEQVLEQRIKKTAFDSQARASAALECAEDTILYLHSPRLTQELGEHAILLLTNETSAEDAPEIFDRVRRLAHYYRATPTGLPAWLQRFVATGYSHYATLLPHAFADRGTTPEQIAGMFGFIFTLESFALAFGCSRSQLLIAVQQAGQSQPEPGKLGLLWTAEWLLNLRTMEDIRAFFAHVLTNPLMMAAFPDYLKGFLLALNFTPRIARFVVELLSKVFGELSNSQLMPYLPELIMRLRSSGQLVQTLLKEASASFPKTLAEFVSWRAPWAEMPKTPPQARQVVAVEAFSPAEQRIRALLFQTPATTDAMARLLGSQPGVWIQEIAQEASAETTTERGDAAAPNEQAVQAVLQRFPAATETMAALLS